MSTKWISKKDEDGNIKHIPIKEKKAFGIPRDKAMIDVEKLRKMGKRARLIETNRNRKLYAPYEAAIDENGNPIPETNTNEAEKTKPETNMNEVKETKSEIKNMDNTTKTLYELGFINDKGKISLNKYILSEFLLKSESAYERDAVVNVQNGKLEFMAMNLWRNAAVKKILPTKLPDGMYEIYYDKEENQIKMEKIDNNDKIKNLDKIFNHYTNYSKEGINVNLEGDQLKKFIETIKNIKENGYYGSGSVIFVKEANSDKVKIKFWNNSQPVDYQIETKVNDGISNPVKVEISAYLLYNTLRMIGKEKDINSISLDLKTDFAMRIHTKQKIDDGESSNAYVESYGLVAPLRDA